MFISKIVLISLSILNCTLMDLELDFAKSIICLWLATHLVYCLPSKAIVLN